MLSMLSMSMWKGEGAKPAGRGRGVLEGRGSGAWRGAGAREGNERGSPYPGF